jgi:hypothetical protein
MAYKRYGGRCGNWLCEGEKFTAIFHKAIENKKNILMPYAISVEELKPNIDSNLIELVQDAKKRLGEIELTIDETKGVIEFHKYTISGKLNPIFPEHEDDFGGVNYKVETVIYYVRKDSGVTGGDIRVYKDESTFDTINTAPVKGKIRVVAFSGTVTHTATEMDGEGERWCIVVQLYSKRNL